MNYKLELQKLQILIDKTENSDERKILLRQAVDIADRNNDLYESLDLRELLMDEEDKADDKLPILKQSIQLADAQNDLEEAFDLRLRLINEENNTSHCVDSFPAIAWLLQTVDNHPDLFKEDDILWEYKWLAVSAINNAEVSKEQILNILEDLKNRLERNGYGLGAYYVPMIEWQETLGDIEGALQTLEEREQYGRDGMSDCDACEKNKKIKIKLIAGKYEEAIADMNEMLMKNISCAEVPYDTYCNLAYYLNKADHSKAEEYFKKGLEEINPEDDSSIITGLSKLINYASYHNKEHALDLYEKYAHWQLESEDIINFTAAKNFLNLFREDQILSLPKINPSMPFYKPEGKYNSTELYNYYLNIAENIAKKFDERNNTDNFKNILQLELN